MRIIQTGSEKKLVISYDEWLDFGQRLGWTAFAFKDTSRLKGALITAPSGFAAIVNLLRKPGPPKAEDLANLWDRFLGDLENLEGTPLPNGTEFKVRWDLKDQLNNAHTIDEPAQQKLAADIIAWADQLGLDLRHAV